MQPSHDRPSCLLGIAMYRQVGDDFHWALVVHETSYDAPNVHVYQINNRARDGRCLAWRTDHTRCQLARYCALAGVFHVGVIDRHISEVDRMLWAYPGGTDGYQYGGFRWSSAVWVIRALDDLQRRNIIRLPSSVEDLYSHVLLRTPLLKGPSKRVITVSLATEAPPHHF
ncbi:hypothetical protein PLICRDRAFT_406842 [Plicaturopsis crispa FD-325 SS-3]|nr:hypothetical protein PLICRDRAFT_406842 [Plicaturopsis crispa FD-325 SS-3]